MSPAPILDLEQDLPKRRFRWGVYFIGIPVILLIMLTPMVAWAFWDTGPEFNGALLFPGFYVCVVIHELGHLIAGRFAGVPTGAFSVGGFTMARSGDHWTFRFDRRWLLGGFVIPLPPSRDFDRGRYAWLVAGGPVASILMSIACWSAFQRFGDGSLQWIGSLFWTSLMAVLAALIPQRSMGIRSDSARLWQLFRDPEGARRWAALVALNGDDMKGVRPRDWDPALVDLMMQADPSEGHYASLQLLASYRSMDQGNPQGAVLNLEKALPYAARQGNKRAMVVCFQWAAALSASVRNNPAQGRVWLERAQKLRAGKLEDLEGIQADIAIAQGRYADALGHLAKRLGEMKKKRLDSGTARFAKERIAEREALCRAALAGSLTAAVPAPPSASR